MIDFAERNLSCRVNWFSFQREHKLPDCETQSQFECFQRWTRTFSTLDTVPVSKLTGCEWSCKQSIFSMHPMTDLWTGPEYGNGSLQLIFALNRGHFFLNEEYTIYDRNSFIADVGGFLGLLLGYSIFSLAQSLSKCVPHKEIQIC